MNLKDALEKSKIHQLIIADGRARRDIFLACCLAMAHSPRLEIKKCHPSAAQLLNPAICVLGTGGVYDSVNHVLDPRHVDRADGLCTFSLLLHELQELNHARSIWPWLKVTEILENEGPNAVARAYRLTKGATTVMEDWMATSSPVEASLIRMLSEMRGVRPGDVIYPIMKRIGMDLRHDLTASREAFVEMSYRGQLRVVGGDIGGLRVLWMDAISGTDVDKWLTGFCKTIMPRPDMVVSPYRRGTGYFIRFAARLNFRPTDLADRLGPTAIATKGGVSIAELDWDLLTPAVESLL